MEPLSPGFRVLLELIRKNPQDQAYKNLYFALASELGSATKKEAVLLPLAYAYYPQFLVDALQIARLIFRENRNSLPALELAHTCLTQLGKTDRLPILAQAIEALKANAPQALPLSPPVVQEHSDPGLGQMWNQNEAPQPAILPFEAIQTDPLPNDVATTIDAPENEERTIVLGISTNMTRASAQTVGPTNDDKTIISTHRTAATQTALPDPTAPVMALQHAVSDAAFCHEALSDLNQRLTAEFNMGHTDFATAIKHAFPGWLQSHRYAAEFPEFVAGLLQGAFAHTLHQDFVSGLVRSGALEHAGFNWREGDSVEALIQQLREMHL